ncbi:hypothetical protein SAMN05443529_108165 [Desulfosporosinus hippei DSM 8344]|uniref:Uncharacterized protein n=1 Tax=Desulfosporosinus hippei DSM 8344 TaxID=1121419 RepID=A0A1G7YV41_9FIRM|nr:hypothetical protein SAMN05443529_108165 [Desulfosporosinus hippei DSM 8344]
MKKKLLILLNIIIVLLALYSLFWVVLILYSKFMTNFSVVLSGSISWVDVLLLIVAISASILYFKIKNRVMTIISFVVLLSRGVIMFLAKM